MTTRPDSGDRDVLRLHRRQFVLGPEAAPFGDQWTCRRLGSSIWVSSCPDLRVAWVADADGAEWVLFGLVVETLEERESPAQQLSRASTAAVEHLYASWAGRWVLAGPTSLHLDAAGLLGCFYGRDGHGRLWASSSPAILARTLSPNSPLAGDSRRLRYATGVSWYPPPRSRFPAIARLLPSQILDLHSGTIRPRRLLPYWEPSAGVDHTLELLRRALVTTLNRLPVGKDVLWMSLSAGADSRLVLAMAHCAGVPIRPFTRIATRMSLADRVLPPRLAHTLGYTHLVFRPNRHGGASRWPVIAAHCTGHVSRGDALPLVQGARDRLEGISIGGQGFGVGKVLGRSFPPSVGDPDVTAGAVARVLGEPPSSYRAAGIRDWLSWCLATPEVGLDWRDRFYIEQRLAGWQSSKEQLYDLVRLERFPVINAARNYGLLLSLPEGWRVGARHQIELIRRTVPLLLTEPVNPRDRYFGVLRAVGLTARDDPLYLGRKALGKLRRLLAGAASGKRA